MLLTDKTSLLGLLSRVRQLKFMSAVSRDHQSTNRSLVVTSAPLLVADDVARLWLLMSINWDVPRSRFTEGELPFLATSRLIRPRIFFALYPRAARNFSPMGVGPILPRLITYAPFSSR